MTKVLKQQLATCALLRKLGFPADHIFVAWNSGDPRTVLQTQGRLFQFTHDVEPDDNVPTDEATYLATWKDAAHAWNNVLSPDQRVRIYTSVYKHRDVLDVILALESHGIDIPKLRARQFVN